VLVSRVPRPARDGPWPSQRRGSETITDDALLATADAAAAEGDEEDEEGA